MTQDALPWFHPHNGPAEWCERNLGPLASINPPRRPTDAEWDAIRASLRRRLVCLHCARACEPADTVHRYQQRDSRNRIVSVHAACLAEWGAAFKALGWTRQHFAAYYLKLNTLAPIRTASTPIALPE